MPKAWWRGNSHPNPPPQLTPTPPRSTIPAMCNLYRLTKAAAEVANLFRVTDRAAGGNRAEEVFPGQPGLVAGRFAGEDALRQMNWGFPLVLKGKQGQPLKPRPVNNARTDKLSGPFWRDSFAQRRCLIPASAYAEAEGPKGGKTRTWLRRPDQEVFAIAGLWRDSAEWGPSYAMVISGACTAVEHVHHRMPVLLRPAEWSQWLQGSPAEAEALCDPWEGEMAVERTEESWVG